MMESVLRHIVEISLSAGVVIALLLLFSTRLNRTFIAKWKYWIWLLLAVRLLIPFNAVLPEAPVRLTMPERAVMPAQFQMAQEQMSVTTPAAPAQATPPQEAGGMPAWTRTELLAVLWLTGAACFLFYHLFSYLHCKRRYLRWSKPISDRRVLAMVDQLTVEMEIRQAVAPLVCDQASSFMMIGFFRHYLLLPRENLPGADLYYILKHELVHLKRGDVWYKLVLLVASAVHWECVIIGATNKSPELNGIYALPLLFFFVKGEHIPCQQPLSRCRTKRAAWGNRSRRPALALASPGRASMSC